MIRRIGIDFGTSTTVVRVKNYEDDGKTYIQDRLGCQVVMFGEFPTVPTLGRQMEGGSWIWGHEAVKERKNSVLYQNFKMDMTHPEKSKKTEELIFGFFRYLYACYSEQDNGGFFGEQGVRTETVISYPVKWQSDQVELLLAAAAQAGFQNVSHMNEAKAAVIAALQQNSDKLCDLGIRRRGDKLKLLLVDMGAGTTDLVLGEYTYDEKEPKWRLISCWPVDEGAATCGGREIDEVFRQFIKTALEEYGEETGGTEIYLRLLQNPKNLPAIKAWKEKDVSDELTKGGTVTDCDVMYNCAGGDIVPFEPITKAVLEKLLSGYISDLIGLVNGCLDNDPEKQNPVDAVLLVGGSSRWYFVPELFAGKEKNGKKIVLKRVQEKPGERIMRLVRPQETVAMGLVLSALPLEVQGDVEIRETETEQAPKQKLQEMQEMQELHTEAGESSSGTGSAVIPVEILRSKVKDLCRRMGKEKEHSDMQCIRDGEQDLPEKDEKGKETVCGRMKRTMGVPSGVRTYLCLDSTLLCNGKLGLMITEMGIVGRTRNSGVEYLSWHQLIMKGRLTTSGYYLLYESEMLGIVQHEVAYVLLGDTEFTTKLMQELCALLDTYRPAAPQVQIGDGGIQAEIRKLIVNMKWAQGKCNRKLLPGETAIPVDQVRSLKTFIEKRKLSKGEKYYFWCDESMFGDGKGSGILLGEGGFYMQMWPYSFRYVRWDQVAGSSFSVKPADGNTGAYIEIGDDPILTYFGNTEEGEDDSAKQIRRTEFIKLIQEIKMLYRAYSE